MSDTTTPPTREEVMAARAERERRVEAAIEACHYEAGSAAWAEYAALESRARAHIEATQAALVTAVKERQACERKTIIGDAETDWYSKCCHDERRAADAYVAALAVLEDA